MQGFGLTYPTLNDPQPPADFSVGGGIYTPTDGGYDYEWMNALGQATDVVAKAMPVFEDLLHTTGIAVEPAEPAPAPGQNGGGIVVEPVPWYERIPPWALAAGAAIGAVLLFKLLEE